MEKEKKADAVALEGFSPLSTTRIYWKSRTRSAMYQKLVGTRMLNFFPTASGRNLDKVPEEIANATPTKPEEETPNQEDAQYSAIASELSERRKALLQPLEPIRNVNGKRASAESLLPLPAFDAASTPKGWLIGKKRKLMNVAVVESMLRIAIQEMNRKDWKIDGLNEQLEEDARCLDHLQLQLLQEKSKRSEVERENAILQEQISMLMNMLEEVNEAPDVP